MFTEPLLLAIIAGVPAFILGALGFWRSMKADRRAERFSSTELIIKGLNDAITLRDKHIDELQADNTYLRQELRSKRRALPRG